MHRQTAPVAYKHTLARPSVRNSHFGIGEGRCDRCEPSSGVVDEVWLAARIPVYSYYCCCEAVSLILPNAHVLLTRRARSASGCRRLLLGVKTASASCSRRGGTFWAMVSVARFKRRHLSLCTSTIGVPSVKTAAAVLLLYNLVRGIHITWYMTYGLTRVWCGLTKK